MAPIHHHFELKGWPEPRVIVRDGQVVQENLHRDRLTHSEIQSEMRLAGIAHLSDVAWAILEPQGKMSFIKRESPGASDSGQQAADDSKTT